MATRISARSAGIHPSATLAVGSRANALRAAGKPVISFAMGEPDFPTPAHVVEAAQAAAADPAMHKYTNTRGLPELREAIAAASLRDIGVEMDPSRLLVTNGSKQADFEVWGTLVDPGDEVLLPAPYWTTYPEAIRFFGGVPVEIPTSAETGFKVDLDRLEAARTERTVALLLCTPSNPTGTVYTDDELRSIGEWALEHGVTVVSDEIYQRLYYPAERTGEATGAGAAPTAPALLRACPEIADQAVILNGVAKSYAMTGWRVGWLYAPQDVVAAATRVQSHLTGNVDNVAQRASLAALVGDQHPVDEMRAAFARRRVRALELLRGIQAFDIFEPHGAFYVYADVRGALESEIAGKRAASSQDLAQIMLDEALVAAVPGEAFGMPGFLRFSYALADDDLEAGLERVAQLFA